MDDMAMRPVTVVLFGATGDLARRKLLPGLLHLFETELIPDLQIIGTSLDEHTEASFVDFVHDAVKEFSENDADMAAWVEFAKRLHWAPGAEGPAGLRAAVEKAEGASEGERTRLHYLSVPPKAALAVVKTLEEADLANGSRIIMEKPFGVDLRSARTSTASCTRSSTSRRSTGSTTSSGRKPRRTSWRSASATASSSRSGTATTSTTSRSTCPRSSASSSERASTSRPAPTRTWSSRTCSRCSRSSRSSRRPRSHPTRSTRRRTRSSGRSCRSIRPTWSAASTRVIATSRASRTIRRPRRSSLSSATSTTGAGPVSRSTCAPASGWPRERGSSRSRSRSRHGRCSRRTRASATTALTI